MNVNDMYNDNGGASCSWKVKISRKEFLPKREYHVT
jgi:hypothetical protein